MRDPDTLSKYMQAGIRMQKWQQEVIDRGEWGPSPGGACVELGCSRAMVDKLVAAGILKRNEYHDPNGRIDIVIISEASIEQAKRNKAERGQWTAIEGA